MKQFVSKWAAFVVGAFASAVMSATATVAMAAPTLLSSSPPGYMGVGGQYCYDFGNYVPATDSPVVGGAHIAVLNSSYNVYGHHFYVMSGFGKVCSQTPLSGLGYSGTAYESHGLWYRSIHPTNADELCIYNPSYDTTSCIKRHAEITCSPGHAVIQAHRYTRTDGIANPIGPIHPYDISGYAHGYSATWAMESGFYDWSTVASGWLQFKPDKVKTILCVKSDTVS